MTYAREHWDHILALATAHIAIVALALAASLAIALPVGIFTARRGRFAAVALGTFGAIYTIPSLALLAILVQFLGLGLAPIFVALVAYAQFMLVRNIVAGLQSIDPSLRDAALGLGMSPKTLFLRVEFPLALPVIIGGVRIAAVAMIALATLGGYVGAGGLGTLIFNGLTLHHNDEIVAGSVATASLAVAADAAFRLLERTARTTSPASAR